MPIGDYFTMTSDSGEISYYYPADDARLSWHELLGNPAQPQRTHDNAAGLQVTSAVLAGMVWAAENASAGIVEAGEIDFARCLQVQRPSLSPVEGHFTTWTPLMGRSLLFPQDIGPTIRGSSEMSPSSSRAGRR
jgi:homospermidine synthase